jgi:hypothetical protein
MPSLSASTEAFFDMAEIPQGWMELAIADESTCRLPHDASMAIYLNPVFSSHNQA